MRNESDLSDMDLDSLKVELTQVEDMIAKEESKVNLTEVSEKSIFFFFCLYFWYYMCVNVFFFLMEMIVMV